MFDRPYPYQLLYTQRGCLNSRQNHLPISPKTHPSLYHHLSSDKPEPPTNSFLDLVEGSKCARHGVCTRVSQMKTLNMFYLVIYWTQKAHNDFIFLCSIVLPHFGHSSNHEYHCWNSQDNRAVVRNFIALLRFSFDSPSYNLNLCLKCLNIPICVTAS